MFVTLRLQANNNNWALNLLLHSQHFLMVSGLATYFLLRLILCVPIKDSVY